MSVQCTEKEEIFYNNSLILEKFHFRFSSSLCSITSHRCLTNIFRVLAAENSRLRHCFSPQKEFASLSLLALLKAFFFLFLFLNCCVQRERMFGRKQLWKKGLNFFS